MRYYIDVETDKAKVRDTEGGDFIDPAHARDEAEQSLRDLIADQLRTGGCLHLGWSAFVRDQMGNTVVQISARELVLNASFRKIFFSTRGTPLSNHATVEASALATVKKAANARRQIRDNIAKARAELLVMKQLTARIKPVDLAQGASEA